MINPIKSVCVLRLSALGDCINAFGLANALHETYKDLDVHFVIDKDSHLYLLMRMVNH